MKTLRILLILSAAFNLAFIGGAIYHRWVAPPPPFKPPEEAMGPHWRDIMNESKTQIEPCRQEAFEARSQFMEALRDPKVGEDSLGAILDRSIRKQVELETRVGQQMIEIRHKLPPEDSRKFFERLHRLGPEGSRHERRSRPMRDEQRP
jgi:uncharacterized membrane protein